MGNIMQVNKKKIIVFLVIGILIFAAVYSCLGMYTNYFKNPTLAAQSIFEEYDDNQIVILDSAQFHNGSYIYILYNATEDCVTKLIIGKKSENQYYVKERVPWYVIGNGDFQAKIEYAVNGVHEIDGETKRFYVWKGAYTNDDLEIVLQEFDKIDVSNIKESYNNVYSVFY